VHYREPTNTRKRRRGHKCGKRRLHYSCVISYKNKRGVCAFCIQCTSEQYQNDPRLRQRVYQHRVKNYARNRQFLADYLAEHPCVDCGENDPLVLDFDHVRGKKKQNVSRMVVDGYCLKTLLKEISKCEVRCANCHRRKSAKQLNYHKVRKGKVAA